MAKFEGWLIKVGGKLFPHELIKIKTYKTTPNQRTEIKAYRNADNLLKRQTSPNFKTKIEFETKSGLHLSDLEKIKKVLDEATINTRERKMKITYWNVEELKYKTATVYMPDIDYTINKISGNDYECESFRLAFVEY